MQSLWESAELIDTNEAISQLSPILIFVLVALTSEKPPIYTFSPIIGSPFIHVKGWNLFFFNMRMLRKKLGEHFFKHY